MRIKKDDNIIKKYIEFIFKEYVLKNKQDDVLENNQDDVDLFLYKK